MFHYRWHFKEDIDKAGTILPLLGDVTLDQQTHQSFKKLFSEMQISRLWVVGSNETTAPIIEASYKRFLQQLEDYLSVNSFLFGSRRSSADYAIFGQLVALTAFDPTPRAIAHEISPRVIAWQDLMVNMSGLEPVEDDWISYEAAQEHLLDIFKEFGKIYLPALLANAKAISAKKKTWTAQIDGAKWEQSSFPYQAKCLQWINDKFDALNKDDQNHIMAF